MCVGSPQANAYGTAVRRHDRFHAEVRLSRAELADVLFALDVVLDEGHCEQFSNLSARRTELLRDKLAAAHALTCDEASG